MTRSMAFALTLAMTALALLVMGQSRPSQGSRVDFFVGTEGECWNVSITSPAAREALIAENAKARFEEPKPAVLAAARSGGYKIHVWPDSEMRCTGVAPEKIVAVDASDQPVIQIPLTVSKKAVSNALGVRAVSFEGDARVTVTQLRQIANGFRLMLVTNESVTGGWPIHAPDVVRVFSTEEADRLEKEETEKAARLRKEQDENAAAERVARIASDVRARLQEICSLPEDRESGKNLNLMVLEANIRSQIGAHEQIVAAVGEFRSCLEAMAAASTKEYSKPAGRLLATLGPAPAAKEENR